MGAIRDEADDGGGSNDGDGAICNSWCWKGSMIVRRIISVPLTIVDVAGTWCFFGSVVPVEEEPSSSSSSEDEPTSNNEDDDGIGGRLRRWLQQQQQQQQEQQQQQIPLTYFDEYGPALLAFAILSTVVLLAVFALFLVQYQYSKQEEEQQDDANSNADDGVDEGGEQRDNDKGDDKGDDNGTFHTIKNNIRKYAMAGKRLYWAQVLVVSLPQFILTSPYVVRQGVTGWALFNYISSGMNSVDKIHKVYRSCCS
eukprot:CAMPEP_0170917552 /NCGR_PEP_ID=MMETSP0735-20130129/7445_1 /TAXON_ID=186038 /ORGANISM="Fragilariopsis kerguelensis, Strain L26-C5" /LENGTH=253 /DNA_ID=CAMNT_0011315841 /DNA_START=29 /DNA_END=790 /DNA_ORIENTATION=-